MSECTKRDCVGCRDDFYNHRTGFDGATQCWSLETAVKVKARDVHINQTPPFLHIPLTTRPSCYKAPQFVRVKPEQLDVRGYWK